MNPRYENHEFEWREEENERRQQQSRKHNQDPFYPDAYYRADTKPRLDFKAWLRKETGCLSKDEFIADRLDDNCTRFEAEQSWQEVVAEFVKAGGDLDDIE